MIRKGLRGKILPLMLDLRPRESEIEGGEREIISSFGGLSVLDAYSIALKSRPMGKKR